MTAQLRGRQVGIRTLGVAAESRALTVAGVGDASPDARRCFPAAGGGKLGLLERRELDMKVDAVQEWAREAAEIPLPFRRRAQT